MRLLGCVGALSIVAAMAAVATAQPSRPDPSATGRADKLFEEGRKLLDAGKYVEACAKFEASIAEADGLGARLNLALCMEKRGKVYTAMMAFQDAAARADRDRQPKYAGVARQHAEQMRPLVPYLTVTITSPVPGEKVVIKRRGEPDREVLGPDPIPLDPTDPSRPDDQIWIEAYAGGYATHKTEPFALPEKAKQTITIPALSTVPATSTPPPSKSRRKLYAYISAGTGLALVIGSTIWANQMQNSINRYCNDPATDDCEEVDGSIAITKQPYKSYQTRIKWHSSILFGAGIAAIGAGVVLYITAPGGGEARDMTAIVPTVSPDGAGLAVTGRF